MTMSPQESFLDDLAERYHQEGDRFTQTRDGIDIAFMDLVQEDGAIEIKLIMVQPALRGRGIGREMLEQVTELADLHDVSLVLCVLPLDTSCEKRLMDFYASAGFEMAPDLCRGNDLVLTRLPSLEVELEPGF